MNLSNPLSFYLYGFGCKAAQYDGEAMAAEMEAGGFERTDDPELARIILVNTCTVTSSADYQARQMIRRMSREHPRARIVITGCYAERDAPALERMDGVALVAGMKQRSRLVDLLAAGPPAADGPENGSSPRREETRTDPEGGYFHHLLFRFGSRSRPFLKIQDGCDESCAYCIVPSVRGASRSLSWPAVEKQLKRFAGEGFREVVLTGVHLGRWGDGLPSGGPAEPSTLAELLRAAISLTLPLRYRLSSIEPLEFTDELLEVVAGCAEMAPHFHLPLQSGSDRILSLMNRPYTGEQFIRCLERIRTAMPRACLGADVLVGFPGETGEDHLETCRLVERSTLDYLHVFPFSPRPGTVAAEMSGRPHGSEVKSRSAFLRRLSDEKRARHVTSFVGEELEVVVLSPGGRKSPRALGLSGNYIQVDFPDAEAGKGEMVTVRGLAADGRRLLGERVPETTK